MHQNLNMKNFKEIAESLKSLQFLCKLVGIPFMAEKTIGDDGSITKGFVFYFTLYATLSLYAIRAVWNTSESIVTGLTIEMTRHSVILILMLVTLYCHYRFRQVLTKSVQLLSHVDGTLMRLPGVVPVDYKVAGRANAKVLVILMTCFTAVRIMLPLLLFGNNFQPANFVQAFTTNWGIFMKSLSKYQCVILMLIPLRVRFAKIAHAFEYYCYYYKGTRTRLEITTLHLHTLCKLHYKVCYVAKCMNAALAFQLLSSLVVSIVDILYQSFSLYVSVSSSVVQGSEFATDWIYYVNPVICIIHEWFEIYFLVRACSKTGKKANRIPAVLHELRNNIRDKRIDEQIQMCSLEMLHQKVEFNAVGAFTIDYPLLLSLFGAVSTYLVIFIQFHRSHAL